MAKYSMKVKGKEVGSASVYAEPHTMTGKKVKASSNPGSGANRSKLDTVDMGVGSIDKTKGEYPVKTTGIKTRGNGAATKGITARGPMA
jgi:hypothetical protein